MIKRIVAALAALVLGLGALALSADSADAGNSLSDRQTGTVKALGRSL